MLTAATTIGRPVNITVTAAEAANRETPNDLDNPLFRLRN